MDVTIWYCRLCHLEPPAREIAQALHAELGVSSELREGFWGTFRIEYRGMEVFDRWKTRGFWGRIGFGRLPQPAEVVAEVRRLRGGDADSAGANLPAVSGESRRELSGAAG